ncbi:hypothetical protein RM844_27005 [Streptomyces sp. DSM 44915]|uniref:NACHT domain-containing protein n=1 Tax=Streptomyces chisholmiae TaxID=3075540 RepID=A0ABU2JYX3_9ACTN|nr:hypothetical protein [Streptomyces sp. DSM 44915]MDT0269934.1 hypothetical protein [Streptomyces sp. DSM 44915]
MERHAGRNRFSGRAHTVVQAAHIHGGIHLPGRARGPGAERARRLAGTVAGADTLAEAVRGEWSQAARDRGLYPTVEVRWSWQRRPHPEPAEAPFPALPDLPAGPDPVAGPDPAAPAVPPARTAGGGLGDLLRAYRRQRSGRLVVLGAAGGGKSAAAILTLLGALRHRQRLTDDAARLAFPVPVLLPVTSWEPDRQHLTDWLVGQLESRYPFLRRRAHGPELAARLVAEGRIALFLDGFDELAPALGDAALAAIDRSATYRVVLFSRPERFAEVGTGRLRGAAVLSLEPLRPADVVDYYRRCHGHPAGEPWAELIAHLTDHPTGPLARALDSPLTLTLLHDAYPDPATRALLADGRPAGREEVLVTLLGRLVDLAYQPAPGPARVRYEPAAARRWLAFLAAGMTRHAAYELDWRRLHWWAPPLPRIAFVALCGLLVGGLSGAVIFGPGGYVAVGHTGVRFGVGYGMGLGVLFGLLVATVAEFRDPRWHRLRRFLTRGGPARRSDPAVGVTTAVLVGLTVGNQTSYPWGLAAGLAVGVLAARDAARVQPEPGRTAWSRARAGLARLAPRAGAAAGVVVGLAYGTTKHAVYGLSAGLTGALVIGVLVGAVRPAAGTDQDADPGAAWARELRHTVLFGVLAGLLVGLVFGYGNSRAAGWGAGLVAALGHAVPIGLASAVAVSDTVRTTLALLQLCPRLPVRGIRFLRDAHARGVLRADGTSYQFRHARLQDQLAAEHDPAR